MTSITRHHVPQTARVVGLDHRLASVLIVLAVAAASVLAVLLGVLVATDAPLSDGATSTGRVVAPAQLPNPRPAGA